MAVEVKAQPVMACRMIDPEHCQNMLDVRAGVDATDRDLSVLIARRFRYMDAAARIKPLRTQVRDEHRKAQVIANATALAAANGWPAEVAAELWERLVEASIAYELAAFDRIRISELRASDGA
jgi:isochorismate pyruvate lyase